MTPSPRKSPAAALLLAPIVLAALAGCAPAAEPSAGASPSPSPSQSATPTPTAASDGSDQLSVPVADIRAWAAQTLPTAGDPRYVSGFSGWLSQETSSSRSVSDKSLAPGTYTVTMACDGRSVLTMTTRDAAGTELAAESVDCSGGGTREYTVTTATAGMTTGLVLESAPTVYAFAVLAAG